LILLYKAKRVSQDPSDMLLAEAKLTQID